MTLSTSASETIGAHSDARPPVALAGAALAGATLVLLPILVIAVQATEVDFREAFALLFRPLVGALLLNTISLVVAASLATAFIGAGAVVTRDVPDFALMAGVPARRVGWMSAAGATLGADFECPLDHSKYRETGPDRLERLGTRSDD